LCRLAAELAFCQPADRSPRGLQTSPGGRIGLEPEKDSRYNPFRRSGALHLRSSYHPSTVDSNGTRLRLAAKLEMNLIPASRPHYLRVMRTFFRNSLVREMAFRGNFVIEVVTNAFWFAAQLVFFSLIFGSVQQVRGWEREEYFAFMATGMIVSTL